MAAALRRMARRPQRTRAAGRARRGSRERRVRARSPSARCRAPAANAAQVAVVGTDGGRRQAPLHAQVVEVASSAAARSAGTACGACGRGAAHRAAADRLRRAPRAHGASSSSRAAAERGRSSLPPPSIAASSRTRSSSSSSVISVTVRPSAHSLGDVQVRVGVRRDLGQVGDAQHLVVARQPPQAAAHRVGRAAADARVDLVEHEGRRVVRRGEHLLDGQRHPRQLAARRDARQRPRRLAGVGGEQEGHLVGAGAVRAPPASRSTAKAASGKPSPRSTSVTAGASRPAATSRACVESAAALLRPRRAGGPSASLRVARSASTSRQARRPPPVRARRARATASSVSPYLRSSPYSVPSRSSSSATGAGVRLRAVGGPAQLVRDVDRLRLEPREATPRGPEASIGAAELPQRPERRGDQVADAPPLAHEALADARRRGGSSRSAPASRARRARSSATSPGRGSRRPRSRPPRARPARAAARARAGSTSSSRQRRLGSARQAADRVRDRVAQRGVATRGVEQVALPGGRQQPLLLVLAVDLDQRPDDGGQARDGAPSRRRCARRVRPCATAPGRR